MTAAAAVDRGRRHASFDTPAPQAAQDDVFRERHGEQGALAPVSNHAGPVRRDQIVAAARDWIGTPYRHQASLKGVGCDCLGLVRGVWREHYGAEPEAPPPYRADWAETGAVE